MVDRDDDLKVGSHSTAILFGDLDLVIQGILYALFLGAMALVGQRAQLGAWYWLGLLVAAVLVGWEFWLARNREREPCFKAFLHNNWVGAALFAGIAAAL
jgi:4-hydroxybenzoate polyprenyltransferase